MSSERRPAAVVIAGLVVGLVSGAALGVVWSALAPRVPVRITPDSPALRGSLLDHSLASDVTFGVLGLVAGVAIAIGLAYMRREHLFSVLVGALLAGAVGTAAMWFVGTGLGSVDIEGLQATTTGELVIDGPLTVSLPGMFLMWPLASAAIVTVLALSDWLGDFRSSDR